MTDPRSSSGVHVIVCGGGIIGACTAYFLTRAGARVTVVERTGIACGASGKAGGFLALDMCDSGELRFLARHSYQLHTELAKELPDVGYRRVNTSAVVVTIPDNNKVVRPRKRSRKSAQAPAWFDCPQAVLRSVETRAQGTTAQVHPFRLTHALLDAAQARGATVRLAVVEALLFADSDASHDASASAGASRDHESKRPQPRVTGVRIRPAPAASTSAASGLGSGPGSVAESAEELLADAVVLAMGPWSALAAHWLPRSMWVRGKYAPGLLDQVAGLKAHSIVLRLKAQTNTRAHATDPTVTGAGSAGVEGKAADRGAVAVGADALFVEIAGDDTSGPEIYPRPDGTVYMCGMAEATARPPADPASVTPTPGVGPRLLELAQALSSSLANDYELERTQACFLPTAPDNDSGRDAHPSDDLESDDCIVGDGLPLIGAMPGVPGLYVGTAHTCWGVLNGPATGQALAELIVHGTAKSFDISLFDPARYSV